MPDQTGEVFGPFLLMRIIGRGGMAVVHAARTPWPEFPLAAVKTLHPQYAQIPVIRERFEHEGKLAVRLHHENVVGAVDVGMVDDHLYVASQLIPGRNVGSIAKLLKAQQRDAPAEIVASILQDGLLGLAYIHGVSDEDGVPLALVHRDVTPGNMLVGYDGSARLADFGVARSALTADKGLTQQGEIVGTPSYLPPEILRGEASDAASDLYGLGAVLYSLACGAAPFEGSVPEILYKATYERPRSLKERRRDLPIWLLDVIERMMTPQRVERPHDARLLAHEVAQASRAAGLQTPRDIVGQWLVDLVGPAVDEEITAYEAIQAVKLSLPRDASVTMAHARASDWLTATDGGDESNPQVILPQPGALDNVDVRAASTLETIQEGPEGAEVSDVVDRFLHQQPRADIAAFRPDTVPSVVARSPRLRRVTTAPAPLRDDVVEDPIAVEPATVATPQHTLPRPASPTPVNPISIGANPPSPIPSSPIAQRAAPPNLGEPAQADHVRIKRTTLLVIASVMFAALAAAIAFGASMFMPRKAGLVERFKSVRAVLEANHRGMPLAPSTAALISDVATALLDGDLPRAERGLVALERLASQ